MHNEDVLTKREPQFICTLIRTRRGFDVKFLGDTFGFHQAKFLQFTKTLASLEVLVTAKTNASNSQW